MSARIVTVANMKARARQLGEAVDVAGLGVDTYPGAVRKSNWDHYRLALVEIEPDQAALDEVLSKLRPDCHVALLLPELDVAGVARRMQDPRINHLFAQPMGVHELRAFGEKLATGAIFGLERLLPDQATVQYQRLSSYPGRLRVLSELEDFVTRQRLRSRVRLEASRVAEEMLMNAMYQAPVDNEGRRVYADVECKARIKRRTPRPVSIRYATHDGNLYLCVRDRYGSFHREDLARYLLRCATTTQQIEDKKLGAGLGLYIIASSVSRLEINMLPGSVTEFIGVVEPPVNGGHLRSVSFTTQRPSQGSPGVSEELLRLLAPASTPLLEHLPPSMPGSALTRALLDWFPAAA
ncbi:MAG: hypothetical protein IT371_16855 [Deltaproteobacteria bacterium]|nr:hypothetical protein [Deltaproteobacteria bacterium]